jgi:hypothetical protein
MFGYKYLNIVSMANPSGALFAHPRERKFREVFDKDRRG